MVKQTMLRLLLSCLAKQTEKQFTRYKEKHAALRFVQPLTAVLEQISVAGRGSTSYRRGHRHIHRSRSTGRAVDRNLRTVAIHGKAAGEYYY